MTNHFLPGQPKGDDDDESEGPSWRVRAGRATETLKTSNESLSVVGVRKQRRKFVFSVAVARVATSTAPAPEETVARSGLISAPGNPEGGNNWSDCGNVSTTTSAH